MSSKSETSSSAPASGSTAATFAEAPLPTQARSPSELLAFTHVFTFDVEEVESSPWVKQADRSDKREIAMRAVVREVLKGTVTPAVGQSFEAELVQIRPPSPWEEPPGLWSRVDVTAGMKLLVVSGGLESGAASDLVREGAVVRIAPADRAVEVHLAKATERVFVDTLASPPDKTVDAEVLASRASLTFALANLAASGDLFGRYLWARIAPSFVRSAERPTPELVALLTAPGAPNGLRLEIQGALDQVGTELGKDPAFLKTVVNGYFRLLLDPGAQPLHHRLVQVSLYLLIFPKDDGNARAPAATVIPDAAARAQYKAALAAFPGDRAAKLSAWLQ